MKPFDWHKAGLFDSDVDVVLYPTEKAIEFELEQMAEEIKTLEQVDFANFWLELQIGLDMMPAPGSICLGCPYLSAINLCCLAKKCIRIGEQAEDH